METIPVNNFPTPEAENDNPTTEVKIESIGDVTTTQPE
jgi:hypothetical protein